MRRRFNQFLIVILILCLSTMSMYPVAALANDEIVPYYNNVSNATATMGISENGKMTITYQYAGSSSVTTRAVITTYIERKILGIFWSRVDIGTTNDEWVDTINDYRYNGSRSYQLSSTGKYRVTINFKIYGSGGAADEIEKQITATY